MVTLFSIVLLEDKDKILLVRRSSTAKFAKGMYSLIGGKVEAGEAGLPAIVREVYEETGLSISSEKFDLVHTFHRKGEESELIALCFKANVASLQAPINKEPEKHDDMRFFSIDDLPANILPAHKQAILLIQQNVRYSEHGWK